MRGIDNQGHIFDEDSKQFMEYAMKHHNVDDISKEERDNQYISYATNCEAHLYYRGVFIEHTRLYECQHAKLRSHSLTLSKILAVSFCEFKINEWQFIFSSEYEYQTGIIENMTKYVHDRFILIIPKIDDNAVYVDGHMMENGYYKIHTEEYIDKDENVWLYLLYVPSRLYVLSEYLYAGYDIYYIAPADQEKYINEYGIIANNRHPIYFHNTKEVYMFSSSHNMYIDRDEETLNILKNNICNNDNEDNSGNYVIYTVHPDQMSDAVEFFRDPYSIYYCYCKTDIPAGAIKKYGTFNINDINSQPEFNGLFSRLNVNRRTKIMHKY